MFGTPITRLDIIWDTYPENNLKMQTQEKRGALTACRTIVEGLTPIPSDWNKFLRNKDNKVDLFRFVGNAVVELSSNLADVAVYSTKDNLAIGHPSHNPDFQTSCPATTKKPTLAFSFTYLMVHNEAIIKYTSGQSTVTLSS